MLNFSRFPFTNKKQLIIIIVNAFTYQTQGNCTRLCNAQSAMVYVLTYPRTYTCCLFEVYIHLFNGRRAVAVIEPLPAFTARLKNWSSCLIYLPHMFRIYRGPVDTRALSYTDVRSARVSYAQNQSNSENLLPSYKYGSWSILQLKVCTQMMQNGIKVFINII